MYSPLSEGQKTWTHCELYPTLGVCWLIHESTAFKLQLCKARSLSNCLRTHISWVPLVCVFKPSIFQKTALLHTPRLEGFNQLYCSHIEMKYEKQPHKEIRLHSKTFSKRKAIYAMWIYLLLTQRAILHRLVLPDGRALNSILSLYSRMVM